jgi:hypothetical protein
MCSFLNWAWKEVGGQLHAPVALLHRKGPPQYPYSRRMGGLQNQYGWFMEETIYFPCQRFEFSVLQSLSQSLYQLWCSGSFWEDKLWIHKTVSLCLKIQWWIEESLYDMHPDVFIKIVAIQNSFTRQKAKLYIIAPHIKKAIATSIPQDTQ